MTWACLFARLPCTITSSWCTITTSICSQLLCRSAGAWQHGPVCLRSCRVPALPGGGTGTPVPLTYGVPALPHGSTGTLVHSCWVLVLRPPSLAGIPVHTYSIPVPKRGDVDKPVHTSVESQGGMWRHKNTGWHTYSVPEPLPGRAGTPVRAPAASPRGGAGTRVHTCAVCQPHNVEESARAFSFTLLFCPSGHHVWPGCTCLDSCRVPEPQRGSQGLLVHVHAMSPCHYMAA